MTFCSGLPSTEYRCNRFSYTQQVERLRGRHQSRFNQIAMARVEVVRLIVFAAIELAVHVVTAHVKMAAVVISFCFLKKSIASILLRDTLAHVARAGKLAMAILFIPVVGVCRPDCAAALCHRISVGVPPASRLDKGMRFINVLSVISLITVVGTVTYTHYRVSRTFRNANNIITSYIWWPGITYAVILNSLSCTFQYLKVDLNELERLRAVEDHVKLQQREIPTIEQSEEQLEILRLKQDKP